MPTDIRKMKRTTKRPPSKGIQRAVTHFMTHKHGDFLDVPIKDLKNNPNQPRKQFDPIKLQELADSIKHTGLLQPILVRVDNDNNFWIVAGERRYRAAKLAELDEVTCIVTTGDPDEISLIENIQRENLEPLELANAFEQMMKKHKYNQSQLGKIIGKSPKTVSAVLSIKKLPKSIIEDLSRRREEGDGLLPISRKTLVDIAQSPSNLVPKLYEAAKKGATSAQIREQRKRVEKPITQRSAETVLREKMKGLTQSLEKIEDPKRLNVTTRATAQELHDELKRILK